MASRIKGITLEIDGNTTKLDKALQSTNRELKDIQSDLKAVERGLKMDPGNVELVAQKQRLLAEAAETSKKKLDDLTKASESMNQALAEGKIDQKQFDAFNVELSLAEANYNAAEIAAEEFNNTAGKIDTVADKVDTVADKVSSVGDKIIAFAQKIGAALGAAIAATTGAAVDFAKESLAVGMEFDSAMSQVAATMGTTVDEIGDLRNFALDMGAKTAFSASEAAEALNYMALAGYDSAKAMEMLPNVLNLAAAGGIDLASASNMITASQAALGLSTKETTELVDKVAMAASKSGTSVAELGQAYLTVGGTAKNLAGGTTELSTALGILADNGIRGAEGGTALRNIILALSAPTDQAKEALDALGVEAYDAFGDLRPLNEILKDLNAKMRIMSQEKRNDLLNTIFNKKDLKSAEALLANAGTRWSELSGYIDDAKGAAQRMADTQLDNLAGDITKFKSAMEGAQITLSDQLTPSMREFVQFGTAGVGELTDAFKADGLNGAMDALGDIISDGLGMITDMLPEVVEAGMSLLEALERGFLSNLPAIGQAGMEILGTLFDGIMDELPGLWSQLFNTIFGLIENGIPALADAAMEMAESIGQGLEEGTPELVRNLIYLIRHLAYQIIESLPQFVKAGMTIISGLLDGFMSFLPELPEYIFYLVKWLTAGISDSLPELVSMGAEFVTSLVQGILIAIPTILEALPDIIAAVTDGLANLISENIPEIFTIGVNLVTALAGAMIEAIPIILASLPSIISAIAEGLLDLLGAFAEVGENIITQIFQGISGPAQSIKDVIAEFFTSTLPQMVQSVLIWFSLLPARVSYTVGLAVGSIIRFFQNLVTSAAEIFPKVVESVSNFFAELPDRVMTFFTETIENIKQWGLDVIAWAQEAIPALVESIGDFFANLPETLLEIGENMINGLLDGIQNAWNSFVETVTGLIDSFVQGVKDALGIHSPSRVFAGIGKNMALGLGEGWDDEFGDVKRSITEGLDFDAGNIAVGASNQTQPYDIGEITRSVVDATSAMGGGVGVPNINMTMTINGDLAALFRLFRIGIQTENARLGPSLAKN